MITPMKKVTILTLKDAKNETLETLRGLEIMHLMPIRLPSSSALNAAKNEVHRLQKLLEALPEKALKGDFPSLPNEQLLSKIQILMQEKKSAEEKANLADQTLLRYQSFGNLDPEEIQELEARGIFVRLYEAQSKKPFSAKGYALVYPFGIGTNGDCYAVINLGDAPAEVEGTSVIPLSLPFASLRTLRETSTESKKLLGEIEVELSKLANQKKYVKSSLRDASDAYNFEEASAGALDADSICALRGFCPAPRIDELKDFAKRLGWGLKIEDPAPDDDVPTLLTYKKLTAPMKFLYDIIGIAPGYREVDVSAVFLCFFSLFFAMIVGDTAYGILFLGITLFLRHKFPKAPATGFHFMELMSVATIVWGILNASYLGFKPDVVSWVKYLDLANYGWVPVPLKQAMLWIRDSENVKYFCFCIGVVHLSIAHIWNIAVKIRQKSSVALAQLGWLCTTWVMFFLAGYMVLGMDLPKFVVPLLCVGVFLLVFFSVPPSKLKEEWISIPMLALNLVSNFVDVISYIRLFAVGMSGAAIAEAFNAMLSPMFGSAAGLLVAAIVLLFVHGLNIALGIMGVAVHAVRLNTLEFSNGLDLQWSGFSFTPFSKQKN
ncbi:MAG: ATPase [Fibrobacteraceae bacterium]|nr:ATPase [Fibrobacteraceae bacterium]